MIDIEKQREARNNRPVLEKAHKKLKMYKLAKDVLGRRIRCDYMYDVFDSTGKIDESARRMVGVCGTVESVDDAGQLHVKWDNGSTLAINPEVDKFAILEERSFGKKRIG